MKTTEIKFGRSVVEIVCDDEAKIQSLADKINDTMDKLRQGNDKTSDAKLAFLTAVMLQDEVEQLKAKLGKAQVSDKNMVTEENFIKTLNSISGYIENIAMKLEKS